MIIILLIAGLLSGVLIFGRLYLPAQFSSEVKLLFSQSEDIPGNSFHNNDLPGLPAPVQRYFNYVLKEGQPFIGSARIRHDGQFKTGIKRDWVNIRGEQYATTKTPGFIWKGTTTMFTARDMYIAGKGRLVVSLFACFKIVDAKGEQYNQGELLRWLGESLLYPTNLLPGERLQWSAIGPKNFERTISSGFAQRVCDWHLNCCDELINQLLWKNRKPFPHRIGARSIFLCS